MKKDLISMIFYIELWTCNFIFGDPLLEFIYLPKGNLLFALYAITPFISYAPCSTANFPRDPLLYKPLTSSLCKEWVLADQKETAAALSKAEKICL